MNTTFLYGWIGNSILGVDVVPEYSLISFSDNLII